jgi:hypothetical protein
MGEAKKKAQTILERPTAEIIHMRQTVIAAGLQKVDPDTADFMRSLGKILGWLDHLEQTDIPPLPKFDA